MNRRRWHILNHNHLKMTSSFIKRVGLPSLILLSISITAYVYLIQIFPATSKAKNLWSDTATTCPKLFNESHPLLRRLYFEGGAFGELVCNIYNVFVAALKYRDDSASELRPLLLNGLLLYGVLVTFMFIESARSNRPYPWGTAVLITSIAQFFTAAVTLPYFWILFLWKQYTQEIPSSLNIIDAKATVAATVMGYFLPTVFFYLYPNSIELNTLWQIFPITILVWKTLFKLIIASSSAEQTPISGDQIITRFYLTAAISGTVYHLTTTPLGFSLSEIANIIPRPVSLLDPSKGDTFPDASALFLLWDIAVITLTPLLPAVWVGGTLVEGVKTFVWFAFAIPLIGPIAAFSAFFYYREQRISRTRSVKVR